WEARGEEGFKARHKLSSISRKAKQRSIRTPYDLFFATFADADPAVGVFLGFLFLPAAGRAADFHTKRGEGGAGAGDVVFPGRGVAVQQQAVPFADGFRQPGHWNLAGLALECLALLLPGRAGAYGLGEPIGDGLLAGVPEVDLDIRLAHGGALCEGVTDRAESSRSVSQRARAVARR